jgi:hypothetical protein
VTGVRRLDFPSDAAQGTLNRKPRLEFSRSTTYSPGGRGSFTFIFLSVADASVTTIGSEETERRIVGEYANSRVPLRT